jgi:hypothetical protein
VEGGVFTQGQARRGGELGFAVTEAPLGDQTLPASDAAGVDRGLGDVGAVDLVGRTREAEIGEFPAEPITERLVGWSKTARASGEASYQPLPMPTA